jgi:acetyl-CoA carboxylase biotin carboxylase subunit
MSSTPPPFNKVLIANRGEIAIRIMRACKELGIKTVAVYSEADANALHVRLADESVLLGAPAPRESYLNIPNILTAAKATGAEAIHPGYGFLSENADFAEAVSAAGLTFIGPPVAAIRAMGDKAESKITMKAAGVPTVPGAEGLTSESEFLEAAKAVGYPVLVKAAAGGGGKGMRVVRSAREMPEALQAARRESQNSFGDDRLLVEKYIENAHHVEFQVFGDQQGNLVHLFERECSVQRRHQKIIEESPSPLLTAELREKMGAVAVKAARAVNYFNAGTIEFIFDPTLSTLRQGSGQAFYFLEMNTRLQVEHPVTEAVTGLDLTQWQIRVAAGENFPFKQADLSQHGHAIECRLYAEDASNGFLPSTGKILQFVEPKGPGIRVDSGIASGSDITHFYDPLLTKLIVHAENREAAIRRMRVALQDTVLHGVTSNVGFLQAILAHPDFAEGKINTKWVETEFDWKPAQVPIEALIAAAIEDTVSGVRSQVSGINEPDPFSPWKSRSGFRV